MSSDPTKTEAERIRPSRRPTCPECGDAVRIKLVVDENGDQEYSYTHCGQYWTFENQPTANEMMDL